MSGPAATGLNGRRELAAKAEPSLLWMVGASLWLVPVLLGGGTTTWVGFAIIGFANLKRSWVLSAVVYGVLAFIVTTDLFPVISAVVHVVLIVVGTVHALITNRRWLTTLWGRRERGFRMLGNGRTRAQAAAGSPVAATAAGPTRTLVPVAVTATAALSAPLASVAAVMRAAVESGERRGLAPNDLVLPSAASVTARPLGTPLPTSVPPAMPMPIPTSAPLSTPVPTSAASSPQLTPLPGQHMTSLPISSTVLPPREPLDPMTASVEALAAIPAVGPERAARIVEARALRVLDSVEAVAEAAGVEGFELVRIRPFLRFPLG